MPLDGMTQTFEITRPDVQPLLPLEAKGHHHSLPPDFVDGLRLLRPFVQRCCEISERWVHLFSSQFHLITNNLAIDYGTGQEEIAIFEYINGFYNPRRRHSALCWESPVVLERKVA